MPKKTIKETTAEEINALYDGSQPIPEVQDEGENLINLEAISMKWDQED